MPTIDLTGYLSSTWFYVLIIVLIGMVLIFAVAILLFFMTYKRRVVIFENVSGRGFQPIMKTRARIIKLGSGGEEILRTMFGGTYLTAYGQKMGKNTYWFAKAQDGYLYNVLLGDLDTKMGMLDIEPVERDVRMFRVAIDRLSRQMHERKSFLEKYGTFAISTVLLIILLVGIWVIVGKIGEVTEPLSTRNEIDLEIAEAQLTLTERLDSIARRLDIEVKEIETGGSGLVPAT